MVGPLKVSTLTISPFASIGVISLRSPTLVNSMSRELVRLLYMQLTQWNDDESVLVVFIQAEGRTFCIGEDLECLYQELDERQGEASRGFQYDRPHSVRTYKNATAPSSVLDFFVQEYRLHFLMHNYSKPIVGWAHGLVRGSGVGLLAACSHRVVTGASQLSLPGVSLGMHSGPGTSRLLRQSPGKTGLFIGLTGVTITASDALFLGLADFFISENKMLILLESLQIRLVSGFVENIISEVLGEIANGCIEELPGSEFKDRALFIDGLVSGGDCIDVCQQMMRCDKDDMWLQNAIDKLRSACPVSMHLIWELYYRGEGTPLKQSLQSELAVTLHSSKQLDMKEGIRALLIDKDNEPLWRFGQVDQVPREHLDAYFNAPWDISPLANM